MIIVVADDITGAAEIAGRAWHSGCSVMLTTDAGSLLHFESVRDDSGNGESVVVIATDTRSMSENDAAAVVGDISEKINSFIGQYCESEISSDTSQRILVFKKVDSAMRGHVQAEIKAFVDHSDIYDDAIYVPANPSKGRVISNGIYLINNIPIDKTDFSFDPEFPAASAIISERFPGIRYADAETPEDIKIIVRNTDSHTLLVGAADLFSALLDNNEPAATTATSSSLGILSQIRGTKIIVCGSTQSTDLSALGLPVSYMPENLKRLCTENKPLDEEISKWTEEALRQYSDSHNLILSIGKKVIAGKRSAMNIRSCMAQTTAGLLAYKYPDELIIEGGSTAFAIINLLGWKNFRIIEELSPGVVRMKASSGVYVTMKPGSYHW